MNPAITIDRLSAGYTREVDILNGISLQVQRSEIVSLLGPNGCGKSTLLKAIAGFVQPRSGRVLLDDADVSALPAHRKMRHCSLGFVPQTENIFGALSVRENLQIGGHYLTPVERHGRIGRLCALYPELARKLDAPAASLSGGQRQILALARALMPRPKVLLLDEPGAGLAPKVLQQVFDAIVEIRNEEQVSILMVEQNAVEALRISDRAYILALGTVALTGQAHELLHDPQVRDLYLGGRTP